MTRARTLVTLAVAMLVLLSIPASTAQPGSAWEITTVTTAVDQRLGGPVEATNDAVAYTCVRDTPPKNGVVWRTEDGGQTWTDTTLVGNGTVAGQQCGLSVHDANHAAVAFVLETDTIHLSFTTNGGDSWNNETFPGNGLLEADVDHYGNDDMVVVHAKDTDDNTLVVRHLLDLVSQGPIEIAGGTENPDDKEIDINAHNETVWAVGYNDQDAPGTYKFNRTTDGGSTWTDTIVVDSGTDEIVYAALAQRKASVNGNVYQTNPDHYAACIHLDGTPRFELHVTTDGGTTWSLNHTANVLDQGDGRNDCGVSWFADRLGMSIVGPHPSESTSVDDHRLMLNFSEDAGSTFTGDTIEQGDYLTAGASIVCGAWWVSGSRGGTGSTNQDHRVARSLESGDTNCPTGGSTPETADHTLGGFTQVTQIISDHRSGSAGNIYIYDRGVTPTNDDENITRATRQLGSATIQAACNVDGWLSVNPALGARPLAVTQDRNELLVQTCDWTGDGVTGVRDGHVLTDATGTFLSAIHYKDATGTAAHPESVDALTANNVRFLDDSDTIQNIWRSNPGNQTASWLTSTHCGVSTCFIDMDETDTGRAVVGDGIATGDAPGVGTRVYAANGLEIARNSSYVPNGVSIHNDTVWACDASSVVRWRIESGALNRQAINTSEGCSDFGLRSSHDGEWLVLGQGDSDVVLMNATSLTFERFANEGTWTAFGIDHPTEFMYLSTNTTVFAYDISDVTGGTTTAPEGPASGVPNSRTNDTTDIDDGLQPSDRPLLSDNTLTAVGNSLVDGGGRTAGALMLAVFLIVGMGTIGATMMQRSGQGAAIGAAGGMVLAFGLQVLPLWLLVTLVILAIGVIVLRMGGGNG